MESRVRRDTLESSSLLLLNDESKYKVNEYMFVNRFVPLLMSDSPETFNVAWIDEVAGGPHNRVTVVDNETGEPLFSVPPLRPSLNVSVDAKLQEYIMGSLAEGSHIPNKVNNDLELLLKYTPFTNSQEVKQHQQEWLAILKRYDADKFFIPISNDDNDKDTLEQPARYDRVDEWS